MRFPLMVSAAYAVVSALWIALSDQAVALLFPERINEIQTYKGWGFILVTAALLFLVLAREDRRRRAVEDALRQSTDAAREAEANMRQARDEAERADRAKSKFLAAASHDLRQPMQSMFFFLEALSGAVQGEKGRSALEFLAAGMGTLRNLLDSLLDISRLETGRIQPQIQKFDIGDPIAHLDASYGPAAARKGLRWQVSPICRKTQVRSDRTLLDRMIRNLIENALNYTHDGEIRVECHVEGTTLRIEVHDTGIGIPADQLENIWEEFHQIGNPERDRSQGLGLGLSIVRRLSELLDHEVRVRSEPGRGSVFSIDLPLVAAATVPHPVADPVTPIPSDEALPAHKPFIQVVDDETLVLLGLRASLLEMGYDVLAAGSLEEAVEALCRTDRRPDIVLADYRLRGGRVGTEVVLRIREIYGQAIPGMLLTGELGPDCHRDADRHQFACAQKPISARQLDTVLRQKLLAAE
jgi:signal transduction histidine kinase